MTAARDYGASMISHENPAERGRLQAVEGFCDPLSQQVITSVGIRSDWICLDVGAGAGSMARWLAGQVPAGQVTAVDLNTDYLSDDSARFTVLQHDVRQDHPGFEGRFDLIHTRLMLEHIVSRDDVVRRLIGWLKPGGWLIVGGIGDVPEDAVALRPIHEALHGMYDTMARQIGTRMGYNRDLPAVLVDAGLASITVVEDQSVIGDGGPGDRVVLNMLDQLAQHVVAAGILTDAKVAAAYEWLRRPPAPQPFRVFSIVQGRLPTVD